MNDDDLEPSMSQFASVADYWRARAEKAEAVLAECRDGKDRAYEERNRVVAALAKCFPAGRKRTAIEGWSADWHGCVYIDLPTGQVSWHYHDSHAWMFEFLPEYQGEWDGHTTEQKYNERLLALPDSELAECREDAERGRFMIEHGSWIRGEITYLAVPVPQGSDLSCYATRQNAIDAARAAENTAPNLRPDKP
jgi:hypothetical protein